jgi:CubicO group peptidase (beta-lactamase class C family)
MKHITTRILVTLGLITLFVSSCKLGRFVYYNFADINDYKIFPTRQLYGSEDKFTFYHTSQHRYPDTFLINNTPVAFDKMLADNQTVAFIIIKNDTIQYETYFNGYSQDAIVPSFSMAKSVTSILIGCAIDDGLIKSVNEPIVKYIPELSARGFDHVTILHVLQMTTALDFNEGYFNPFGHVASFYYGKKLRQQVFNLKLKGTPGQSFEYVSGNTQLLGLVLERALQNKTITQYLQEKLWGPMHMEYDASWSLDQKKNGIEKTFCCLNARARDFAKIGRLYLNGGNWNGQQLVSKQWVQQSTKLDNSQGASFNYQYQWWLPSHHGDYMAQGILGQYIYVNPKHNVVIVRLGKNYGKLNWPELFMQLAEYSSK